MKNIYRCLIIEDEIVYSNLIITYLGKYNNFKNPRKTATLSEALDEIKKTSFDLIFYNIQLSDEKVIDFLNATRSDIPIILLSTNTKHSLSEYEANVIDYLVKPFSSERFDSAVSKAMEILAGKAYFYRNENNRLEYILFSRYKLSPTECAICKSVAAGRTINEIMNMHSITRNTYKTHMRHIYAKTIDLDKVPIRDNQRKLQRLTYFLISLP